MAALIFRLYQRAAYINDCDNYNGHKQSSSKILSNEMRDGAITFLRPSLSSMFSEKKFPTELGQLVQHVS
jgi:hypothetical protein